MKPQESIEQIDLDQNGADKLASFVRSVFGACPVPFVGNMMGEIICSVIPNQRADRMKSYLLMLTDKLKDLDQEVIAQKMRLEEYIDLFEDTLFAAARALTDERKEQIACLFKNGLTDDEINIKNHKRLLYILNQLDDVDLIFLNYYVLENWMLDKSREYYGLFRDILKDKRVYLGGGIDQLDQKEYQLIHKRQLYKFNTSYII